jgi:hypothetical protein
LKGYGEKRWRWFYFGLVFGFLLVSLEEVSWGQRIFHLGTPDWVQSINGQEEINFHNVRGMRHILGIGIHYARVSCIVLSICVWLLDRLLIERWQAYMWLPTPIFIPALLCIESHGWMTPKLLTDILPLKLDNLPLLMSRLQEPKELIFWGVVLAFLVTVYRYVRMSQPRAVWLRRDTEPEAGKVLGQYDGTK